MKKILTYAALAAISLAFVGCNREFDAPIRTEEEGISLNLFCLDPALTKAVPEATATENAITSLEYFFFKGEDASKPALRKRVTNPSFTNNVYSIKFTADGKAADFNNVTLNDLFTADGKSEFFVVTNAPEIGDKSLTQIKQTAAEVTFANKKGDGYDVYDNSVLNPFVMTGAITLQLGDLTQDVELKRLAAKMTFDVNVAKVITKSKTVDGAQVTETWRPILAGNNVRIYPSDVAFSAVLGGTAVAEPTSIANYNPHYFRVGSDPIAGNPQTGYTNLSGSDEVNWVLPTSPAFYTYPRKWKAGEKTEPNIKLIIPWMMERKDANGNVIYSTQKELYYKVMLTDLEFVSNGWYNYTIDVDVLGNEADDPTVIAPSKYVVEDWNTVFIDLINSQMTDAMYLSIDKKEVTFYTAASPNVNITASDAVTPHIVSITQKNLNGGDDYIIAANDAAGADMSKYAEEFATIQSWVSLNGSGGNYTLEIEHALDNDLSSDTFDATEYTFVVKLLLEGDTAEKYAKTVTFTQIPAIFVEAQENSNYALGSSNYNSNNGYVFVHKNTSYGDGRNWNAVAGIEKYGDEKGNNNPNMYIITASVVPSKYTIGDPRETTPDLLDYGHYEPVGWFDYQFVSDWTTAPWTEGNSHQLTYYYPTKTDANTESMIAPSFRIASSYGKCGNSITFENAERRCASYQEDGYPAGRWRVPTRAEIEFIATLSGKQRIPKLFRENSTGYWSASTGVTISENTGTVSDKTGNGNCWVRCVYDEWYWSEKDANGNETNIVSKTTFTWGDKQR